MDASDGHQSNATVPEHASGARNGRVGSLSRTPARTSTRSRLAHLSDEELLTLIRRPGAVEELFDRLGACAYGLAVRIVRDPSTAAEIVHESFLALRRSAVPPGAELGSTRRRLTTLVHRRAVSFVRTKTGSSNLGDPPDWLGGGPEFDNERALSLLRRLPEAQVRVIELAYLDAFTLGEIADELDAPIAVIKARMVAGLVGLREMLAEPSSSIKAHRSEARASS